MSSTPRFTESREKIYKNNPILAIDDVPQNGIFARTITTKQDRNPNSGIIEYKNNSLVDWNTHYRNLTPRECFLLMGFNERQYDDLMRSNVSVREGKRMLADTKLIKLAGNSIVVPVLEAIFKQVVDLNEMLGN
ncbi:DNA cytosine methyltransferase [Limosilactobacillus fermentum]|uniref:DNA cytosine methyltransferase n=1 Tax=Limosilactobacillus fermentum TaxID=1613 RepID=UPI00300DC4C9